MVARAWFYIIAITALILTFFLSMFWQGALWFLAVIVPLIGVGIYDIVQTKSNILRNYPVWGHWRYILLSIRPQIQQYFINSDQSGRPFNKEMRDLVYERAEGTEDAMPFGTQLDVGGLEYEWVNHSMSPKEPTTENLRVKFGGPQCRQPYTASRLNVSAMSFGAISSEAVRALNRGAKIGNFYQDTGEGGLSKHHLAEGGDIVWEIGTGYFGCKAEDGGFDPNQFQIKARNPRVKMTEIKISQGAKPAHGAILPAAKLTEEIAEARGIQMGTDCLSPPAHSTFSTPIELMHWIAELRELSDGKPVGFKLCIGIRAEFMAICKAILETKIYPDFIVIDGSEGGTGAAPVEFSDHVGTPLNDGLSFAHNCLVGTNLREHIRLVASGKIISGFDIATKIALGADTCNSARGMMFSLGCVQSRRCHTNTCPTGVATQDPTRRYALDVNLRAPQVARFHESTIKSFLTVLGAVGLEKPEQLHPRHIHRRVGNNVSLTYAEVYPLLEAGSLLNGSAPDEFMKHWHMANAATFTANMGETHKAKSH